MTRTSLGCDEFGGWPPPGQLSALKEQERHSATLPRDALSSASWAARRSRDFLLLPAVPAIE